MNLIKQTLLDNGYIELMTGFNRFYKPFISGGCIFVFLDEINHYVRFEYRYNDNTEQFIALEQTVLDILDTFIVDTEERFKLFKDNIKFKKL